MIIQNAKLRGKEGLWQLIIKDGVFHEITQKQLKFQMVNK